MNKLLQIAKNEGTPIIEGESVTFIWRGKQAPELVGDLTNWDSSRPLTLERLAPGVWARMLTFPRDAYIEYVFTRGKKRIPDPLNPRASPNGVGGINNFFYMPEAAPTPLVERKRDVPKGKVSRHVVKMPSWVATGKRTIHLYQPPTKEPSPLLVVFDGDDYLRRAQLPTMVDNLIAQKRIRPIALALVDNAGGERGLEYRCNDSTVGFILAGVLPFARERLNLIDVERSPGADGLLGASYGGLISLYVGLRLPHIFGHVLSQSGGFSQGEYDYVVYDLVRDSAPKPLRVWMDVGRYEWLLQTNRRMHELLQSKGYDITYREYNAGHNYPAWRDDVWRGLEAMFGAERDKVKSVKEDK